MRPSIPAALVLLLAAGQTAEAVEFVPGWDADWNWSSNVFRSPDEDQFGRKIPKEDDFSLRTGPDVRFRDLLGDLTYDVGYKLRYEEFVRLDGISEFEHFLNATGTWAATDRTSFSFSDDFADAASLNALFDVVPGTADVIIRAARQRVSSNTAQASARHRLGRLWEFSLSGTHQFTDFENPDASDSSTLVGNVQLTRGLTPRLVVGAGGSAQRNEFESGVANVDDSGTTFFQGFAVLRYSFSRSFQITANAGPALSMPDTTDDVEDVQIVRLQPWVLSSCPVRDDGTPVVSVAQAQFLGVTRTRCDLLLPTGSELGIPGNDNQFVPVVNLGDTLAVPFLGETGVQDALTYFGRIEIQKQWRFWAVSLSYGRSASSGSGLGTSTIVDAFTGALRWAPTRRWTLRLTANLTMQSAVSEIRAQEVALRPVLRDVTFQGPLDTPSGPVPIQITRQVEVGEPFEITSGEKIDNPIDVRTYRVQLRGDRRFTQNLTGNATASWYRQTSSNEFAENSRTEFRVSVGLTWTFDPIPL